MAHLKLFALISALILSLTELSYADTIERHCLSAYQKNQISQLLEQAMKDTRFNIPGLSLTLATRCGDIYYSKGFANLESDMPIAHQTYFRVGSVTKAFTGYLIMILAQQNLLSVNNTVGELLPELRQKLPQFKLDNITVRQLLNHTSGIPTYTSLNKGIYESVLQNPTRIWSHDDIIEAISKTKLLFPSGTNFNYSNSNYYLLGLIVEKVTHTTYEDAMKNFVIRPLGLNHTFVPSPGESALPIQAARGYMEIDTSNSNLRDFSSVDPSYPWAAGSIISTTSDLAKFAKALYERRLLVGRFRDELYFPVPEVPGYYYGVGIIKNENDFTLGHEGNIFGFECSSRYLLKSGIALGMCVNRSLFDSTLPPDSSIDTVIVEKIISAINSYPSSQIAQKISNEKIESLRRKGNIKGLQLSIIQGMEQANFKYGTNGNAQWTDHDLLRIASVSKSFIAALVIKLAERGELNITDTLDKYLKAKVLPKIDQKKITIGDLLRHSSGVADYFTESFIQKILKEPGRIKTEEDALLAVKELPSLFPPGTKVSYSNTNYILLGMILDSIAKKHKMLNHSTLLREIILAPFALQSTFYENKEQKLYKDKNIASGFLDEQDYLKTQQGYGLANGGLLSTVSDVSSFFAGLFKTSLGEKMIPLEGESFGYGLYRLSPKTAPAFVGHTGEFAGYLSFAAYNPVTHMTIVGFADDSSEKAKEEFTNIREYLFSLF